MRSAHGGPHAWGGLRHAGPYTARTRSMVLSHTLAQIVVPSTPADARALMAAASRIRILPVHEHMRSIEIRGEAVLAYQPPRRSHWTRGPASRRRRSGDYFVRRYFHVALGSPSASPRRAQALSSISGPCAARSPAILDVARLAPACSCSRGLAHVGIGESTSRHSSMNKRSDLDAPVRIIVALERRPLFAAVEFIPAVR